MTTSTLMSYVPVSFRHINPCSNMFIPLNQHRPRPRYLHRHHRRLRHHPLRLRLPPQVHEGGPGSFDVSTS